MSARPEVSVSEETCRDGRDDDMRSYYGRPVLKEPVWSWEIPWYFFTGGLAGASASLAAGARLAGNEKLASRAKLVVLAGTAVSPALLVSDLGRPERFYNMLRVFKPTSPMSVGTWILSAFGTSVGIAGASEMLSVFPRLGRLCGAVAALLGPAISTYTAVLIADTSVPVWHEARREMSLIFAASSAASAGAAAVILTPTEDAGPSRRLAVGGALAELLASEVMKRRLGTLLSEPYHEGEAGRYERLSTALSGLGAASVGLLGRKSRAASVAGGGLLLAGAALKRWSIFKAGFQSARDPKYTVIPQRDRRHAGGEARDA